MLNAALEMHQASHVYVSAKEANLAVERITFSVRTGEFVSLVGPSGCGKTTVLHMLAGLLAPTEGSVRLFGQPLTGTTPKIGYMLQQDYLLPWRTIWDNAVLGLEILGSLDREASSYVEHLLEEMSLSDYKNRYPHELSGGMRQRAALVRTLASRPEVLLLDEPFSALDYQTKLQLEDLIAETLRAHAKTAVLVTHDISEAIAMSDRVLVMGRNPGRIQTAYEMPAAIRQKVPFEAREQAEFHGIFNEIWKQLESASTSGFMERE